MITVSLCMIVKNEEDVLERCLASAAPLADEIIIVDTGSTDATKEIAAKYTAKVFDYPWQNDFAAYDCFIVGASTWFDGELPTYWDELLPELRTMKLKGKKVAIFGLGDQIRYPENFADGIGLLAEVFEEDEATLVGFTSSEGYTFERSKALRGEQWCGLVVDLDNQSEQAEKKIKAWCQQLKKEFA